MSAPDVARGDVWVVDLDPTRGHEQGGTRPCLVVSADPFNEGTAGLVVVLPMTTKFKNIVSHVPLRPPEGGTKSLSFIKCEDMRSVDKSRVSHRWGAVSASTLEQVEARLRLILAL